MAYMEMRIISGGIKPIAVALSIIILLPISAAASWTLAGLDPEGDANKPFLDMRDFYFSIDSECLYVKMVCAGSITAASEDNRWYRVALDSVPGGGQLKDSYDSRQIYDYYASVQYSKSGSDGWLYRYDGYWNRVCPISVSFENSNCGIVFGIPLKETIFENDRTCFSFSTGNGKGNVADDLSNSYPDGVSVSSSSVPAASTTGMIVLLASTSSAFAIFLAFPATRKMFCQSVRTSRRN